MSPLTSSNRLSILRTVLQHPFLRPPPQRTMRSFSSSPSPLSSSEPSSSSSQRISRSTLHRLHRLSSLNPPIPDSKEETQLIEELSDLISLMDEVKQVELPSSVDERAELLNQGVFSEVLVSQDTLDEVDRTRSEAQARSNEDYKVEQMGDREHKEKERSGKELLGWSTNRLGDYYASRIKRKEE